MSERMEQTKAFARQNAEQTHAIKTVIRPNGTTIKLYWAPSLNAYVTIPDETKTAADRAIEQGRQPDHE